MNLSSLNNNLSEIIKSLSEKSIGAVSQNINVVLQLDKTTHASDRQSRHTGSFISDSEIKNLASRSLKKISNMLIFDKIDVGNQIVIKDGATGLNVVGALKQSGNDLDLVIITVINKKNFIPKGGTKMGKV